MRYAKFLYFVKLTNGSMSGFPMQAHAASRACLDATCTSRFVSHTFILPPGNEGTRRRYHRQSVIVRSVANINQDNETKLLVAWPATRRGGGPTKTVNRA